jgi:hypothetical protein
LGREGGYNPRSSATIMRKFGREVLVIVDG